LLKTDSAVYNDLKYLNPFMYRGYVYDIESGLYYLQSRYYDPEMGRFINADALVSTGQGVLGNNMFAYCTDNPISRVDPKGNSYTDIFPVCYGGNVETRSVIGFSEDNSICEALLQVALNSYVHDIDLCVDNILFVSVAYVGEYTTSIVSSLDKTVVLGGFAVSGISASSKLCAISLGFCSVGQFCIVAGLLIAGYGVYREFAPASINIADKTYDQYCVSIEWVSVIHPNNDPSIYVYRRNNVAVYYLHKSSGIQFQYYTYSSRSTTHYAS